MSGDDWLSRAHYHLSGWGIWRRANRGEVTRGYPSRSAMLSTGYMGSELDHLVEAEDAKAAATSDSIIDGLPFLYRTALESEYILQGVIKHNRRSTGELLLDAQLAFWERAKRWLV